jgi:hypothetical protein
MLKNQDRIEVNYQRDLPASPGGEKWPIGLSGFAVSSNSQAMLHSEHMFDLGGPISMRPRPGGWEVVNDSQLALEDAAVIGPEGVAWIGPLASGAAARLVFREAEGDPSHSDAAAALLSSLGAPVDIYVPAREKSLTTARRFPPDVLNIRQLVRLAQNKTPPGEIRLVAWTVEEIPGMRIEPAASQARHANVVIACLQHAPEKPPRLDVKTRADVDKEEPTEREKPTGQP